MKHKWHKEIKAWADGAEIEFNLGNAWNKWIYTFEPLWDMDDYKFRIKPQPKEEPYWLCCGCKDPRHNKSCLEAKMGHPERCRFGTASEHFKPQPKEPQYLYVWIRHDEEGETVITHQKPKGVLSDSVYKYVGKIKLEQDDE